jgi:hypothetical protein
MSFIESVKVVLPDYAKDTKLNLDAVLLRGTLDADVAMVDLFSDETSIDTRYHCVCVEHTDYTPISFEDVKKRIRDEGGEIGFKNGNGPTM